MTDSEQRRLIAEYKSLEEARDYEASKAISRQSEINYFEDKMAAIEAWFQEADLDITMFL